MSSRPRGRFSGAPPQPPPGSTRGHRDEDLALFRELFKREQDRAVSLLDPVSDEFEPAAGNGHHQGSNAPYKLPTTKKVSPYDFFAADEKKNDYDWLKTPPATPLFPSLELEAGDMANMVVHKELPILQPIKSSRTPGTTEKQRLAQRPRSPSSSSASSSRSATPRALPLMESMKLAAVVAASTPKYATHNESPPSNDRAAHSEKKPNTPRSRSVSRKDDQVDREVLKKLSVGGGALKVRTRGTSPTPKSSFPATLPGFTDETPRNLITSAPPSRSTSATRGRPGAALSQEDTRPESRSRRPSCSPSVARGRKSPSPGLGREGEHNVEVRGRFQSSSRNGGSVVVGSKMVEKMMTARRVADRGGEKGTSAAASATTGGTGFGKLMSKSSLDMALKNLDIRKEPSQLQKPNTTAAAVANRSIRTPSAPVRSGSIDTVSPRVPPGSEARGLRGRFIGGGNDGRSVLANKGEGRSNKYGF